LTITVSSKVATLLDQIIVHVSIYKHLLALVSL